MTTAKPGWDGQVFRKNWNPASGLGPNLAILVGNENFPTQKLGELPTILHADRTRKLAPQILGFREFALNLVALWLNDAENQRFKLPQVLISDCQIDTEAVP